jgi:(p)ppGpp synthase/HD superfamily hydrolase
MGSNIDNVQSRERDGMTSNLEFVLTVRSRHHLARIMRRLRQIAQVVRILRVNR